MVPQAKELRLAATRASSAVAPWLWNSLSPEARLAPALPLFRKLVRRSLLGRLFISSVNCINFNVFLGTLWVLMARSGFLMFEFENGVLWIALLAALGALLTHG